MKHGPSPFTRPATLTAVAALLYLIPSARPAGLPAAATATVQAAPDTLVGTVGAVDARQRQLRVIAGTGFALRTVTFRVPPEVRPTAPGAALTLNDLQRGDVVRVVGGTRPEGRVAYSIERLVQAGTDPGTAP
ncbi:MAG: hypothetical protein ACREMJ_08590 [Gemmatimonadales bacterium]